MNKFTILAKRIRRAHHQILGIGESIHRENRVLDSSNCIDKELLFQFLGASKIVGLVHFSPAHYVHFNPARVVHYQRFFAVICKNTIFVCISCPL